MYKRELAQKIIKNLSQNPAVAILGPRQIGKTTLAHEIAKGHASIYLDLESPEDFQKLKDPGCPVLEGARVPSKNFTACA